MTDIKNHDTGPSPALVIGLRNRACVTRDLAIALAALESIRQTHGMPIHRAGLFAGLLCSRVESPFIASQTRVVGVLLAWPALSESLLRPRSLAAQGGAIPVRSFRISNHESHSTLAPNIMSLWLRLHSGGGVVVWFGLAVELLRSGLAAGSLCDTLAERVSKRVPAASAKGKEKAKPAFKSKWIIVLGWLVYNKWCWC
jgi:hypothetical protein